MAIIPTVIFSEMTTFIILAILCLSIISSWSHFGNDLEIELK